MKSRTISVEKVLKSCKFIKFGIMSTNRAKILTFGVSLECGVDIRGWF